MKGTWGQIIIPFIPGTLELRNTRTHGYGAAHADWTLSENEQEASFIVVTNANAGCNAILSKAIPGKIYAIYNNSGQTLTFKVSGQTGGTIANGKHALYLCGLTDLVEIWEQS